MNPQRFTPAGKFLDELIAMLFQKRSNGTAQAFGRNNGNAIQVQGKV